MPGGAWKYREAESSPGPADRFLLLRCMGRPSLASDLVGIVPLGTCARNAGSTELAVCRS
jgi:hypothetical protein